MRVQRARNAKKSWRHNRGCVFSCKNTSQQIRAHSILLHVGFLPRLSNKHFLTLIEWLSSRTGIWRRGTNDQISGDFHAYLIALRARSAMLLKSLLTLPRLLEVSCWFQRSFFLYTHKIKLWFHWWCYV